MVLLELKTLFKYVQIHSRSFQSFSNFKSELQIFCPKFNELFSDLRSLVRRIYIVALIMQHEKHTVFIFLSFCYPISIFSFSEHLGGTFKFWQYLIVTCVIINTLGLIKVTSILHGERTFVTVAARLSE